MEKRTDLSYFPPNPYGQGAPPIPTTRAQRRQIKQTWTTTPGLLIRVRRWLRPRAVSRSPRG